MSSKVKTTKKRWKPRPGLPLGPQERRVLATLADGERSVRALFHAVMAGRPKIVHALLSLRGKQQKIGAIVSRLNRKLKGRRVVAGTEAGTYRLRRVR